jgi:hypothetical protein
MPSILSLLDTPEPPRMTMKPRPGTRSLDDLNAQIDAILTAPNLDPEYRALSRATVLLWHDHFEASHKIAQDIEGANGSLLHAMIHRREPDYSNARYWFRRVGPNHPSFECIVGKVKVALIHGRSELTITQIIPNDKWQPLGFVSLVEDFSRREDPAYDTLLRRIQAAEFHCFLATLPSRVDPILPKRAFGPPSM